MATERIHVDPAHLRYGAGLFDGHHRDLADVMAEIRKGHEDLQDVWSGAVADSVGAAWDDLHPQVRTQIDRISDYAEKLRVAALQYLSMDEGNAADIGGAAPEVRA
ncbi:WXG100 family type VII secretion target [Nocardia brasiliensis]|uniref:WXG100 family type VII secretion target n=1 Tax=Nocardia brasiliensis TaxID=37326 RepID=UPI002457278B|nr:WXG100 family type VII secretion target [Nocardia brasiliensis]